MTKTLSDYFFLLHQNQNIFFSNIGNQNIFLENTPPSYCTLMILPMESVIDLYIENYIYGLVFELN
jgi:hypothetical protein